MKKLLFIFLSLTSFASATLLLSSCGNSDTASENEILIEGRFIHSRANVVFIDVIHVEDIERTDSLILDEDGTFRFQRETDKPLFLKISTAEDNFITLIAEPGQTITLSGDINALAESYTVSGSPASEILAQYLAFSRNQFKNLDTLALIWENNKYAENKMAVRDSLDSTAKIIYKNQTDYTLNLINKNPESLGSLFVLYQYFGRQPVLDPFEYFSVYENLAKKLAAKYPDFEHVGHLNMKVNKTRLAIKEEEEIKNRLDTGKVAPDFSLPDINENQFKLSELQGYVVLIHFWASWSAESMRQLPAIRQYQQNYGPKGLAIVSISFDYDREMWTATVEKEKMKWTNICDLKYTDSPIAKLYHIEKTPYFFLLDREGIIVSKNSNIDIVGNAIYKLFRPI
ncbi:MAG: redoxin domain-containing protein [Bacteroidales bacterium]